MPTTSSIQLKYPIQWNKDCYKTINVVLSPNATNPQIVSAYHVSFVDHRPVAEYILAQADARQKALSGAAGAAKANKPKL